MEIVGWNFPGSELRSKPIIDRSAEICAAEICLVLLSTQGSRDGTPSYSFQLTGVLPEAPGSSCSGRRPRAGTKERLTICPGTASCMARMARDPKLQLQVASMCAIAKDACVSVVRVVRLQWRRGGRGSGLLRSRIGRYKLLGFVSDFLAFPEAYCISRSRRYRRRLTQLCESIMLCQVLSWTAVRPWELEFGQACDY